MPGAMPKHEVLPPAAGAGQGTLPGESVYQLESTWTDQDAARVPVGALQGKAQVVAMFYTNCQYVCPLIVDEMKKLEREIPELMRTQVGFALFSFDSARDTAAVLKAYEGKRDLDGRRWRMYTGAPDQVLELAAVLGVRYRKEPSGEFSHSAIITVLDRNGVIRYQMLGLNQDRAPLVNALRAAAQG
jgi:protein SCO1/2